MRRLLKITWHIIAGAAIIATLNSCDTAASDNGVDRTHLFHASSHNRIVHYPFNVQRLPSVPIYSRTVWFYRHTIGVPAISFVASNDIQCFMLPKGAVTCTGLEYATKGCVPYRVIIPNSDSIKQAQVTVFYGQRCLLTAPPSEQIINVPAGYKISFNNATCLVVGASKKMGDKGANMLNTVVNLVCENATHGVRIAGSRIISTW